MCALMFVAACVSPNNRRQYGQLYLTEDGGFRIVGRPDKSAVSIMAHGQICASVPNRGQSPLPLITILKHLCIFSCFGLSCTGCFC